MAFTIQLHTGERSRADDVEVLISLYGREEDVQDILLDRKNSVKKDQPHLFHAGQVRRSYEPQIVHPHTLQYVTVGMSYRMTCICIGR